MKKAFCLLCAALLIFGSLLPFVGYRLAQAVLVPSVSESTTSSLEPTFSQPETEPTQHSSAEVDADAFLIKDQSSGDVQTVSKRDYLIGAVAAEMPVSWPDEALKAQAVAAHSYALYCRDHAASPEEGWLSADPARRQGYLTDPVLRSYWGVDYEANYARLSALVDSVLNEVVCYESAPAGTSYFAISNGMTEASENVWGSALPYLIPVDSSFDLTADNYEYTIRLSPQQVSSQLASGLGILTSGSSPENWFGTPELTASGYVSSLPVCSQTITGSALRRVLGLRSACFTIQYQADIFSITTRGYGHGVGMSQWGAKAMAEQGASYADILAHYFPGTEIWH